MKKNNRTYREKQENVFAQSTGDLMAGLLFIFILLLMGALLKVQEKAEQEAEIVRQYDNIKTQLYIDLQDEFQDNLKDWRASIDSTLCVRFQEPSMLFDNNKANLKNEFQDILKDFFPRYVSILGKYKNNIEEIRIEGHTDSNGEYFYNMELSQNRTRTVLEFCFALLKEDQKEWAKSCITANGLSSSHPVLIDGIENKALSRRVEFRVRTNAEKQLEKIANKRLK